MKKDKEFTIETLRKNNIENEIIDDELSHDSIDNRKSEDETSIFLDEIEDFLDFFYNKTNGLDKKITEFHKKSSIFRNDVNSSQKFLNNFAKLNLAIVKNHFAERITNVSKYKELKSKFTEMRIFCRSEKTGNNHWHIRLYEFYRSNKTDIDLVLIKLIEFYENATNRIKFFEEVVIIDHVKFLTFHNLNPCFSDTQNSEIAKIIFDEDFFKDIIHEVFEKNCQDTLQAIKEKIKKIVYEANILKKHNKQELDANYKSELEESTEISEKALGYEDTNKLQNNRNLQELLDFIMNEDNSSKKKKKRKNMNKKNNETSHKIKNNEKKNTNLIANNSSEIEAADKEIEEFRKKLKENSTHANKIEKVKPCTTKEWKIMRLKI